jgi:uncharacterized protein (TIRG00374 family)
MEKQDRSVYKKIFWMLFSTLLAVVTVWAILKQSRSLSVEQLFNVMIDGKKPYLIISIICAAAYVVFEGVAICSILKGISYKRSLRKGLLYSTSDVYFSAITPSATGGQPASAYFMHRDGIPTGVVSATLILNLMMYTAAIVFLGIIAVILHPGFFRDFETPSRVLIVIGFIVLTGLTIFFFMVLKKGDSVFSFVRSIVDFLCRKKIIHNSEHALGKISETHKDYKNCAKLFAGKGDILIKAFIFNVLQRASQIAVPMFMHLCLGGNNRDSITLFAKQCLITIGYNFVPVPGAMGVADYLMIDGFSNIMTHEAALQLDMLSRGITFYFCVTISGLVTLGGYLWTKKKR